MVGGAFRRGIKVNRSAITLAEVFQTADRLSSRLLVLLGLAAVFAGMALVLTDPAIRMACAVASGSLMMLVGLVKGMGQLSRNRTPGLDKS